MAKTATKAETEVKETKKKQVAEGKRRIVIEVSEDKLDDINVLADLFGKPQYVVVERAFAEYIRQNAKAIANFKEIRKQVLDNFDVETNRLTKE